MKRMCRFGRFLLVLAGPAIAAGCVHASARSVTDSPPLEMPAPPARVVETVEATPVQPAQLAEEPAHQQVRPPTARPMRPEPRTEAPSREAQKPDVKPEGATDVAKTADEQKPPTTLQTTPTVAEAEVERAIRGSLSRASASLGRVDYRLLNKDARTQYDTAKRFIEQAEEAMEPRSRNLLFARNLADKALALAEQLGGR